MSRHIAYSILFVVLHLITHLLSAQVLETKNWCLSKCNIAGDEKENTKLVFMQAQNEAIKNSVAFRSSIRFPLRIGIVQQDSVEVELKEITVRRAIDQLNEAFSGGGIVFYIDRVDVILSPLHIEDLSPDHYAAYNDFSDQYDLPNTISLYIFDTKQDFCKIGPERIRCGKLSGFSYVLSRRTNNVVLTRFDLDDQKIVVHEFGHFFGLYHTFEEVQFGKDEFAPGDCEIKGDCICDTPPDPSPIFEVYVNYSNCEMVGLQAESGDPYKPDLRNYMAYYKPCYLKTYRFSPHQLLVMKTAALSEIRSFLSR